MYKRILLVCIVLVVALSIAETAFAQQGRITEVRGTVELKPPNANVWQSAAVGAVVSNGTVISTGIRSTAVISIGSSTITVSPLTVLTLEELVRRENTEAANLYLRNGRIQADVSAPAGHQAEFTVRSPITTASVRGTSFTFNGRKLTVHSGQVAFSNNSSGQKVFVNQNQNSHVDAGGHGRITPPFEAEAATFRPSLPELADTGSVREQSPPAEVLAGSRIIFDWP